MGLSVFWRPRAGRQRAPNKGYLKNHTVLEHARFTGYFKECMKHPVKLSALDRTKNPNPTEPVSPDFVPVPAATDDKSTGDRQWVKVQETSRGESSTGNSPKTIQSRL